METALVVPRIRPGDRTRKLLPAGVEPVSRFSLKVTVRVVSSTVALENVGGVSSVLLVTVRPAKLPASLPEVSLSLLLDGWVKLTVTVSPSSTAEASVTVTTAPEMETVPEPAMVRAVPPDGVASTLKLLPAGREVVFRFSL